MLLFILFFLTSFFDFSIPEKKQWNKRRNVNSPCKNVACCNFKSCTFIACVWSFSRYQTLWHTLNFTLFLSLVFFLFFVLQPFSILSSSRNQGDRNIHNSVREKTRNTCQQKFAQISNVIAGSSVPSSVPETRDSWR